jgi:hypothetical protein
LEVDSSVLAEAARVYTKARQAARRAKGSAKMECASLMSRARRRREGGMERGEWVAVVSVALNIGQR